MQLVESPGSILIHIPMSLKRRSGRKHIIVPDGELPKQSAKPPTYQDSLIIAFARAFRWKKLLDEGKYASIAQMAETLGINRWYMSRILRLTLIAPDIVEAIVEGAGTDGMSLEKLRRPWPMAWEEQKVRIAYGDIFC